MAVAILSSKPGERNALGQLPIDEAPLKSIHIVAAAAVLGGAALDGYVLGIVGPACRGRRPSCSFRRSAKGSSPRAR